MDEIEKRIRAAFEMEELMISIQRESFRREHPDASSSEIEARLQEWLLRPEPVPSRFREPKTS